MLFRSGDLGLIPGLGRSPGEGNSYPLQYSCLENFMDCIPSPGDLPNPGIKAVFPALAGGFFTTEPPGKPAHFFWLAILSFLSYESSLYILATSCLSDVCFANNFSLSFIFLIGSSEA